MDRLSHSTNANANATNATNASVPIFVIAEMVKIT